MLEFFIGLSLFTVVVYLLFKLNQGFKKLGQCFNSVMTTYSLEVEAEENEKQLAQLRRLQNQKINMCSEEKYQYHFMTHDQKNIKF